MWTNYDPHLHKLIKGNKRHYSPYRLSRCSRTNPIILSITLWDCRSSTEFPLFISRDLAIDGRRHYRAT